MILFVEKNMSEMLYQSGLFKHFSMFITCLLKSIASVSLVQAIHSVGWHHEGKQFMCSHSDGSLTMWNLRNTTKPFQVTFPHGEMRYPFRIFWETSHAVKTLTLQQTDIEHTPDEDKPLIWCIDCPPSVSAPQCCGLCADLCWQCILTLSWPLIMNSPLTVTCDLRQNDKTGRQERSPSTVNVRERSIGPMTMIVHVPDICQIFSITQGKNERKGRGQRELKGNRDEQRIQINELILAGECIITAAAPA